MTKDTVIKGKAGRFYKLTPKTLHFIEELKKFFAERGIPEEEIPTYLAELARRKSVAELTRRKSEGSEDI